MQPHNSYENLKMFSRECFISKETEQRTCKRIDVRGEIFCLYYFTAFTLRDTKGHETKGRARFSS